MVGLPPLESTAWGRSNALLSAGSTAGAAAIAGAIAVGISAAGWSVLLPVTASSASSPCPAAVLAGSRLITWRYSSIDSCTSPSARRSTAFCRAMAISCWRRSSSCFCPARTPSTSESTMIASASNVTVAMMTVAQRGKALRRGPPPGAAGPGAPPLCVQFSPSRGLPLCVTRRFLLMASRCAAFVGERNSLQGEIGKS